MLNMFKRKEKFPVTIELINKWKKQFGSLWNYLEINSAGKHTAREIYNGCRWMYMAWNFMEENETPKESNDSYRSDNCDNMVKFFSSGTPEIIQVSTAHFNDKDVKLWVNIIIENKKNG